MRQRHIHAIRFVIMKYGVTLAESTARAILPTQSHPSSFEQQTSECQRLGQCPIDIRTGVSIPAPLDYLRELRMHMEIGGECGKALQKLKVNFTFDARGRH